MGLHYIYVNSQDKKADEVVSDFTINLHNPITSVKRVGISSFTTSNNSYNVNVNNNKVRWLEQQVDNMGQPTRNMEVIIPTGYYSINELLTLIVRLMTGTTIATDKDGRNVIQRNIASEAKVTYSYSINENYEVSIIGTGRQVIPYQTNIGAFIHT